jgi:hypothetical protein
VIGKPELLILFFGVDFGWDFEEGEGLFDALHFRWFESERPDRNEGSIRGLCCYFIYCVRL